MQMLTKSQHNKFAIFCQFAGKFIWRWHIYNREKACCTWRRILWKKEKFLSRHPVLRQFLWVSQCREKPNTYSWPLLHRDSESGLRIVPHGNPQLHHDQPGCHFFCLFELNRLMTTKFCFVIAVCYCSKLGALWNQTYPKENKHRSVDIWMKLLVTMGNTFDCKIRSAVFRGVQWYVILYDGIFNMS